LFSAIAFAETSKGTSSAVVEKNNPGGLMGSDGLMTFPTLDDGIQAMGDTLHNLIINRGLTSISGLGSVYAPIGSSNDPNNLNANWVPNVTSFVNSLGGLTMNCSSNDNSNISVGSNGEMQYFNNVMKVMLPYEGNPYVWGGNNPSTGFDCSGFIQWAFGKVGINLPRTALDQYNATQRIPASEAKAGDLVFFRGTYGSSDFVSHVGIYVGNGKMFNANDSGIEYSDITTGYWAEHSPEFGRIQ
jgi:cell wall-associated NlpC family hydrolase